MEETRQSMGGVHWDPWSVGMRGKRTNRRYGREIETIPRPTPVFLPSPLPSVGYVTKTGPHPSTV